MFLLGSSQFSLVYSLTWIDVIRYRPNCLIWGYRRTPKTTLGLKRVIYDQLRRFWLKITSCGSSWEIIFNGKCYCFRRIYMKQNCLNGEHNIFVGFLRLYVSINESLKKFYTVSLGVFINSVKKSEWLWINEVKSWVQVSRYEFLKGFWRFTHVYSG